MNVKICGVTRAQDAVAAAEDGAWAVGVVFDRRSRRRCSLAQAETICRAIRSRVELAGVFVDEPLDNVVAAARRLELTLIQLHGAETAQYCAKLARLVPAKVIKAIAVDSPAALARASAYPTDFHLFDGRAPGTGAAFDWMLAAGWPERERLILAGGLHADNVAAAISLARPFAVDVSSGVESRPGIKDRGRVREFIAAARGAAGEALRVPAESG